MKDLKFLIYIKGGIMKNWKTTLIGALGASLTIVYGLISQGRVSTEQIILAGAMAFLGFFSKDYNVSGK